MNTIRIPTRYHRQFARLKKDERSCILMGLFDLANGQDLTLHDTPAGDLLELIWRDCLLMEAKNTRFDKNAVGTILPGHPVTEGKGREGKGKERKTKTASEIKNDTIVNTNTKSAIEIFHNYHLAELAKDEEKENVPKNENYEWVLKNTPQLIDMKTPLTIEQSQWFADNYPEDIWKDVMENMQNLPDLKKKYVSAKATANNWLKRRKWLPYDRMKKATFWEANDVMGGNQRAMSIYQNKNPMGFNKKQ